MVYTNECQFLSRIENEKIPTLEMELNKVGFARAGKDNPSDGTSGNDPRFAGLFIVPVLRTIILYTITSCLQ